MKGQNFEIAFRMYFWQADQGGPGGAHLIVDRKCMSSLVFSKCHLTSYDELRCSDRKCLFTFDTSVFDKGFIVWLFLPRP